MIQTETYYSILQVDPAAEPEVIESAYHRLARKYHPDVNRSAEATARMAAINRAYTTLSSPDRRAVYDRELRRAAAGRRTGGVAATARSTVGRSSPPSAATISQYWLEVQAVTARARTSWQQWALAWAAALETSIAGNSGGQRAASVAAHGCLEELSGCLNSWEQLVHPPAARRLGELGAACLKLELALVRGTLAFVEAADYSVLQPLAGLAEHVRGLNTTLAAEAVSVSRAV